MTIYTPRDQWPDWLLAARTENALVQIIAGRVVWHGGVWHGGDWHGGDWRGGDDNPTRCKFPVRGAGQMIRVGCKTYTIAEARALCAGGDLPAEAPPRDSEAGRLLRAAVLAQIAWQEALADRMESNA